MDLLLVNEAKARSFKKPLFNIIMKLTFFIPIDGSDFSYSGPQTYTFNASTNVSTINITFMKDNVYEINETFQARLSFHGQPLQRVMISPDTIHATIFDDDGK